MYIYIYVYKYIRIYMPNLLEDGDRFRGFGHIDFASEERVEAAIGIDVYL
jgi:hypothetical protein